MAQVRNELSNNDRITLNYSLKSQLVFPHFCTINQLLINSTSHVEIEIIEVQAVTFAKTKRASCTSELLCHINIKISLSTQSL